MSEEKLLLLTSEHCAGCATIKEMLKEQLENGEIEELKVDNDGIGAKVAAMLEVRAVPTPVLKDEDGLHLCKIDVVDGRVKITCGEDKEFEF